MDDNETLEPIPIETSPEIQSDESAVPSTNEVSEDDLFDPGLLSIAAESYLDYKYEDAENELLSIYENTAWTDKEMAARNVSEILHHLQRYNEIEPEPFKLNAEAVDITNVLLDNSLDETAKIAKIDEWTENSINALYESDDPKSLKDAYTAEKILNQYNLELRRSAVAKDTNSIKDFLVRGAEAAVAPIFGTADLVFDTEYRDELREFSALNTNPELDDTILAGVASGAGSVGGFIASSFAGPYTALGYLGATLTNQAKETYDVALEETGSTDAAMQAVIDSSPGMALSVFADRLLGTSVESVFRGAPKGLGLLKKGRAAITGAAFESATETFEEFNQGVALSKATGDPRYIPTNEELFRIAASSAIVGGAAGSLADIGNAFNERQLTQEKTKLEKEKQAVDSVESAMLEAAAAPETAMVRDQVESYNTQKNLQKSIQETLDIPQNENPSEQSAMMQFITNPEETLDTDKGDIQTRDIDENSGPLKDYVISDQVKAQMEQDRDTSITGEDAVAASMQNPPEKYTKLLPVRRENDFSSPFMPVLAKLLDTSLGVANISSWGFYNPGKNLIKLKRGIFQNITQAYSTLAHEIGHAVDYFGMREDVKADLSKREKGPNQMADEPITHKLVRLSNYFRSIFDNDQVTQEARLISSLWRPDWEGAPEPSKIPPIPGTRQYRDWEYNVYRNKNTEIQADVFSALINNPEWVATNAPTLYDAFLTGLPTQPIVEQFWNYFQKLRTDPLAAQAWAFNETIKANDRHAEIQKEALDKQIITSKKQLWESVKKLPPEIRKAAIRQEAILKDYYDTLKDGSKTKQEAAKHINRVRAPKLSSAKVEALLETPLKSLFKQFKETTWGKFTAEEIGDIWSNYEVDNRIVNETNTTIEDIKSNPEGYLSAYEELKTAFSETFPISENVFKDIDPGKPLLEQLAENQLNFEAKVNSDSKTAFIKKLIDKLSGDPESPVALAFNLISPETFRVRRFLPNYAKDYKSAVAGIQFAKQKIGEENFAKLQEFSDTFHDIMADAILPELERSEIVSKEMLENMKLNKGNYVMFNVLKYFEQDPKISATIKKQFGTFDAIGEAITSTVLKTEKLMYWADYQMANNSIVSLANMSDYEVEHVTPESKFYQTKNKGTQVIRENIYQMRDRLQGKDKENSYIIAMEDGKPSLYKINSPEFAELLSSSKLMKNPLTGTILRLLDSFNLVFMERELKTLFNPIFTAWSKFRDRSNEAAVAGSPVWMPTFFFHTDPKLKAIDKASKKEAAMFRKGELSDIVNEMIHQHILPRSITKDVGGITEDTISAANMFFDLTGRPTADESKLRFSEYINKKGNTIINAIGGKFIREIGERDEIRTKINVYKIARDIHGFSPEEAAIFANEHGGIPDMFGGGREASAINKGFLFGRAHINGVRSLYNLFKNHPKMMGTQYFFRVGVPYMMINSAIMAPIVGALFGDDEGLITKKLLDKIPSYDKLSKWNIPLGFEDSQGKTRLIGDFTANEIAEDWKTITFALPYAYEMVTFNGLMNILYQPLFEMLETGTVSGATITEEIAKNFTAILGGNIAPGAKTIKHLSDIASGENPQDYFRRRGIFTKDVQAAGDFYDKFSQYMMWSLAQTYPVIFNARTDKLNSDEPMSFYEQFIGIPGIGPSLRSFVRVSNYGDYERDTTKKLQKDEMDATIRLQMKDNTLKLRNLYLRYDREARNMTTADKANPSNSTLQNKIETYRRWNNKIYRPLFNEMRAAYEMGDEAKYNRLNKQLEQASTRFLSGLSANDK